MALMTKLKIFKYLIEFACLVYEKKLETIIYRSLSILSRCNLVTSKDMLKKGDLVTLICYLDKRYVKSKIASSVIRLLIKFF